MKLTVINFDWGQTWWMNALVNHHKVCWICIEKKCVNCVMFSHSKGFFSSLCNAWAKSHYFLILLSCWKFWGFHSNAQAFASQELKVERTGPSTKKLPSLQAIDSFTIPIHLIKHLYEKNQIQIKSKFS